MEDFLDYQKYQKYKRKYLDLKNQMEQKNKMLGGDGRVQGDKKKEGKDKIMGGTNDRPFALLDDIHFWGRQMMEHMLFLGWGLTGPEDKTSSSNQVITEINEHKLKAAKVYEEWKKFMNDNFWKETTPKPDLMNVTDLGIDPNDKELLAKVNEPFIVLMDETNTTKREILEVIINKDSTGETVWQGWSFPSLLRHMLSEVDYTKMITGDENAKKKFIKEYGSELNFILKHHNEEVATTAQLIDPGEEKLIDDVRMYAKFAAVLEGIKNDKDLPPEYKSFLKLDKDEQLSLIGLALKYSKQLMDFADKNVVPAVKDGRTIIPQVLLHHVNREFHRFDQTLKYLEDLNKNN